ncbi:dihydrolipoamide acetyltransferase family protein [Streptomyces sp. NPDC092369]|uniref:dihydrolipoamide acetyltransferase family protein n=1 Tax=Streptomyces sp. NPDC092369 TaxID=3366015 RepID=UPI0038292C47
MAHLLRMPEVAANVTVAVLHEWFVAEGDSFAAFDPIVSVETDKALVDVEAETPGVVLRLVVPAGSQVDVGAPIALMGSADEQAGDIDALLAELGAGTTSASPASERRTVAEPAATILPAAATSPLSPAADQPASSTAVHGERIFSSPLARRVAREAGLALDRINGTGPHGRITRRDVDAALADERARNEDAPDGESEDPAPTPMDLRSQPRVAAGHTDAPHDRMRRAIASRLTRSKQEVPHFYLRATVRVDRLLALRQKLNASGDLRISVNDMVVKAVACAHSQVPAMNVVWLPDALRRFDQVDVSVAVTTERGLVTPVLRGVDGMTVSTVAKTVRDYVERARAGRLRQDELEGGSVTVSNLGMYGTEDFTAIINPPQAAILAVGAAREEPVAHKGKVAVRNTMRVTLSVDHRAVDGALAAEWLRAFVGVVEDPIRLLA